MTNLSDKQVKVLKALYDLTDSLGETCLHFKTIERRTNLTRAEVRNVARELRALNYARYLRGLMSDDGMCAGSGYGITGQGVSVIAAMLNDDRLPS